METIYRSSQMSKCFLGIVALFLILFSKDAFCAQLRLDFSQDNRTYVWNTSLDCRPEIKRRFSWGFSSAINSMLTKRSVFSNNQDRWQENGRIDLSMSYALTSRLRVGGLFSQNISSLEKRKVTSSEYGITSEYDISGVKVLQTIGGKDIDRRLNQGRRKDTGFNHSLKLSHSPRVLPHSVTTISFSQINSRLTNIPLVERDLSLSFVKSFSPEDSLSVFYQEGWSKKDFYQGDLVEALVNTQRSSQRVINLRSSARIPSHIKVGFDFDLALSKYRYSGEPTPYGRGLRDNSSSSQGFRVRVERGFWGRFVAQSFYKYRQREEDYADDPRDQKVESGELGGNLSIQIRRSDSLYLTASAGVTSFYAQEASGRFDDRDILTLIAWGEYLHVFGPVFSLRMEGGFRNFHRIYVSGLRSANNNRNQTYVLSPTLIWKPHQSFGVEQNYNIQANYIYYDYEKSIESTRNRLFRRASTSTRMTYRIFPRVSLALGYTYGYEDYGQLIWKDQWARKPSWERRSHNVNISLEYRPARNMVLSPQYTYQRRKTWDHFAEPLTFKKRRALRDEFNRNLISVSCKYFIDDRNYVSLSGARRVQESTSSPEETYDYATVSVNRIF
ncbi:MAG: hypothetical protein JSV10_07410 [Candidatus Zixiibacteriota bacterium]|nr:MAG: hypothetical protein JSV10_07410 [candidate division Zixibacteria bacterium]